MHTVRVALLALVLFLVAPLTAQAQPPVAPATSVLLFDHDGSGPVERFERQIDTGAWAPVTPTRQGTAQTFSVSFPALTPGPHSLKLRACNVAGCAESDPFLFVVAVTPAKPSTLRVGTAAADGGTR